MPKERLVVSQAPLRETRRTQEQLIVVCAHNFLAATARGRSEACSPGGSIDGREL